MKRLPKPPAPTDEDLNLTPLVDHDGIRCLPDAPRWWEEDPPAFVTPCRSVPDNGIIEFEVPLKRKPSFVMIMDP